MQMGVARIKASFRRVRWVLSIPVGIVLVIVAVHFPYATDPPTVESQTEVGAEAERFYEEVYSSAAPTEPRASDDHSYVQFAQNAGKEQGVEDVVQQFVDQYGLANARVLEVGAGSGVLQDIVENYTGLDIAASAARYFHKPFVAGSATDLPFDDNEFDAVWTIWVLEHVPNPERVMSELRRVTKPGGYILLWPAWSCKSWAANGYEVRPYSDFDFTGKIVKASLVVRKNYFYRGIGVISSRILRRLALLSGQPAQFHYTRLEPNFERYWVADGDAVNSLDPHEAMLWHQTRGDDCLNCPRTLDEQLLMRVQHLEIRVNKSPED
jgi:SAM-dependent methyltransferase